MNVFIILSGIQLVYIVFYAEKNKQWIFAFTDKKYLSNPPLKSTVLKAALVTLSLIFFFSKSLNIPYHSDNSED